MTNNQPINMSETTSTTLNFNWDISNIAAIPKEISLPVTIKIPSDSDDFRIPYEALVYYMYRGFMSKGVCKEIAALCASKLADNDRWGIKTHGFNRFYAIYIKKIEQGIIAPNALPEIIEINGSQAVIDAHNGLGYVAAHCASNLAAALAEAYGTSLVTVKNSNHFGTCRNWTEPLAAKGFMAECGTTARPSVAPTFGVKGMLGTNPYATALPTELGIYSSDSASSTRHNGNLEVYVKKNEPIPAGWVVGLDGNTITNPHDALKAVRERRAAFTPLGGVGEEMGGHKGYGLSTKVEILSCSFCDGSPSRKAGGVGEDGKPTPHLLAHFFRATKIHDLEAFKANSSDILKAIKESDKTPGYTGPIYFPGEKELLAEAKNNELGVPLNKCMIEPIQHYQKELELGELIVFE